MVENQRENQREKPMLFFGVRLDEFDPKIRIYGTSDGLRYLSRILLQLADDPQTDLHELEKSVFTQLKQSDPESPIIEDSLSATVGRMDHKADGSVDGFLTAICSESGEHAQFKRVNKSCQ